MTKIDPIIAVKDIEASSQCINQYLAVEVCTGKETLIFWYLQMTKF
jgi:hypothetical protein